MEAKQKGFFSLSAKSVPIALLIILFLAFGILSPWLGFYQDDWHFIYYAFARGLSKLWELSAYDNRPFASWPYITGFVLLGFRPFGWQIAVLLVRWLTTVAFWMIYRTLWPKNVRLAAAAALIFAVYPLYTLQPMAVTYITHWVCFFLFGLSVLLMIEGVRQPKKLWPLLLLSFALDGIQLFTIEYFNGLELLRPLILWFVISDSSEDKKGNLRKTFLYWIPYLVVLGAFIIWRGFIFKSPARDTNTPFILYDLFSTPLSTTIYLITAALKDTLIIQIGSWANTLQPSLIDFSTAGIVFIAIAIVSSMGIVIYLGKLSLTTDEGKVDPSSLFQALTFGILGLVLGPIPAWVTDQPIYSSNPLWNSRLGMASMFGAALVIAALIEWLIKTPKQRLVIYGILIGLSINFLLHSGNTYRNVWTAETQFYEQLIWRAPSIQPNTALVTDQEIIAYMGDYPMGFAINSIYAKAGGSPGETVPYWYFSLTNNFGDQLDSYFGGMPISAKKFSIRFRGDSTTNLTATFSPEQGECLWLLRPQESNAPYLSSVQQQAAKISDPGRISTQSDRTLFSVIFGDNPPKTWCYYYEKAQLATDQNDWPSVIQYLQEARQVDLKPGNDLEYLPFIEAYSRLGDWNSVSSLLGEIQLHQKSIRPSLCLLWNQIQQETASSPERDRLIAESRIQANCP